MDYFKMPPFESDITVDILSRVEAEQVVECKSVCKSWNQVVSNHPLFNKIHSHHHLNRPPPSDGKLGFLVFGNFQDSAKDVNFKYVEYNESHDQTTTRMMRYTPPPFEDPMFIGSINGLICIVSDLSVVVSNPFKNEYVMLPTIKTDFWDGVHNGTWGFGYVSSTNEYKIVQILSSDESRKTSEVHVYTLGSGKGWRNLGVFDFGYERPYCYGTGGAFANGTLYWLAVYEDKLLTFDLAEEKFLQNLSLPKGNWRDEEIGVLNGFLYCTLYRREANCYDVWLLKRKNDGDDRQSLAWSEEFKVGRIELLAVTKSGDILTWDDYHLNVYDTKASTSKMLVDISGRIYQVFPHKNTLICLEELGERVQRDRS